MDIKKNLGFLLKDASRRYVLRFEQHAREISMTLMQCKALVHLAKNEGVSQAKLSELADMEPMMMVRILDRMEADKVLERRPDPDDRRARRLYLTKKSGALLGEVERLVEVTRNEMLAGINKADRDVFMRVLERVHENACALSQDPAVPASSPLPLRRSRSSAATTR